MIKYYTFVYVHVYEFNVHFFRCNTDLGDNDLEFTIIRGIQYNLPESKCL